MFTHDSRGADLAAEAQHALVELENWPIAMRIMRRIDTQAAVAPAIPDRPYSLITLCHGEHDRRSE